MTQSRKILGKRLFLRITFFCFEDPKKEANNEKEKCETSLFIFLFFFFLQSAGMREFFVLFGRVRVVSHFHVFFKNRSKKQSQGEQTMMSNRYFQFNSFLGS
jgi:hypothetical protein